MHPPRYRLRTLMLAVAGVASIMEIGAAIAPNVSPFVLPFAASLVVTGISWAESKAQRLPVHSGDLIRAFSRMTFVGYALYFLWLCLAFAADR